MPLTLQQVFGVNVIQNDTTLTINKSDLPLLTPSINNRAEQLIAAILLHFYFQYEGVLIDENGDFIVDENNNTIAALINPLSNFITTFYWKKQFLIRGSEQYIQHTIVLDLFATPPPEDSQVLTASNFL